MPEYRSSLRSWEPKRVDQRFGILAYTVSHDFRNIISVHVSDESGTRLPKAKECAEWFGISDTDEVLKLPTMIGHGAKDLRDLDVLERSGGQGMYKPTHAGNFLGRPAAAQALRGAAETGVSVSGALGGRANPYSRGKAIASLYEDGPQRVSDISEIIDKQTVTTWNNLQALGEMGLVRGEGDAFEKDPEAVLTEKGTEFARKVVEPLHRTAVDTEIAKELRDSLDRYERNPDVYREDAAQTFSLYSKQYLSRR